MTAPEDASPPGRPPPRRLLRFLIVGAGAAVALVLAQKAPKDQHLRFTLGEAAPAVTSLEVAYVAEGGGDPLREMRLAFEPGKAPRVVSHDPSLADGAYLLRIGADTREGRRTVERQVTLGGGTTQVDLSAALGAPTPPRTP